MLAHILDTAKSFLGISSTAQESPINATSTETTAHGIQVSMVTTRRGTETPGQEATPRSSVKRRASKRELEVEVADTPTAAKRQRRSLPKRNVVEEVSLPVETENDAVHDSTEDTSDTIAVAIPVENAKKDAHLPIRRRSSPKVVVAKISPVVAEFKDTEQAIEDDVPVATQESVYETPAQQSGSTFETSATQKTPEGSPTPKEQKRNERTSAKKSSVRKKKTLSGPAVDLADSIVIAETTPLPSSYADEIPSSTYDSEQAPVTSQDAPQPEKSHLRFDSEDPERTPKPIHMNLQGHKRYEAPAQTQAADSSDDSASDSDEAPEVLTTSAAASKAALSAQDTARALLAQQEKARQKRLDRQQRVKEEQADKRKREDKRAKKIARKIAKQQAAAATEDLDSEPEDLNTSTLPSLLPQSLLSSLPTHRLPTPPPTKPTLTPAQLHAQKLNSHIKFLERSDKTPKDRKAGKHSVAVLRQGKKALPPKVSKGSRNVREGWLKGREKAGKVQGRHVGSGRVERRGFGKTSFTVGGDSD